MQPLLSLSQVASILIFQGFYEMRIDLKVFLKLRYIKLIENKNYLLEILSASLI